MGSSKEGLAAAYAIQQNLDYDHGLEIVVWPQSVFAATQPALMSLLDSLKRFDAAVFVFSPDDTILKRGVESPAVRDNLIFELGLFIGHMGLDRCFVVTPRSFSNLHLPTDLLGVSTVTFNDSRNDRSFVAALGAPSNQIRIALLGHEAPAPSSPEQGFEQFLTSHAFRLFFNPQTQRSKRIRLGPDGYLIEGNNKNEHAWRITDGKLELLQLDGNVHSRFRYDAEKKRFVHTNDPDTKSIKGQYILLDDGDDKPT